MLKDMEGKNIGKGKNEMNIIVQVYVGRNIVM